MLHGAPAPAMPRTALAAPVYGARVPTIALNLSTVEPGPLPADACAITPTATSVTTRAGIQNLLLLISVVLPMSRRVYGLRQPCGGRQELRGWSDESPVRR